MVIWKFHMVILEILYGHLEILYGHLEMSFLLFPFVSHVHLYDGCSGRHLFFYYKEQLLFVLCAINNVPRLEKYYPTNRRKR